MKSRLSSAPLAILLSVVLLAGCGGSGSSGSTTATGSSGGGGSSGTAGTATLNMNVVDDRGFALDGATVTTSTDATSSQASLRTAVTTRAAGNTDTDGRLALEVGNGTTVIVRVSLNGHAEQTRRLELSAGADTADLTVALRRLEQPIVLADAELGGSVSGLDGVSLTVPAGGAFVDGNGNPVVGDVEVFMSPIDVTDERAVRAFPGEFEGVDENGDRSPIASFGVADYRFFQGGEELELAGGQTATIRIPLYATTDLDGTPLAAGASIPLWSLDEDTGIWQQEGFGTVVADVASPTGLSVEGDVTHFSPWNIDKVAPIFDAGGGSAQDPNTAEIGVRVACGSSGTPCDPALPPVELVLRTAVPGMAVVRVEFLLPVDAEQRITLPVGVPLELEARGVDGSFGAEIEPASSFTLATGDVREFEAVLGPLHELNRTFTPGARLRGEMTNVGETHDYLFDVRAGESFSVAAFAAESLFSPAGTSGGLGGRVSVLDDNGDIVASEVFDAFQVARLDAPVTKDGVWSVRIEAEGKVPGFYVATTGLRLLQPLVTTTAYIKPGITVSQFGTKLAMDGELLVSNPFTDDLLGLVHEREPGTGWVLTAELPQLPNGAIPLPTYALEGDTLAVGVNSNGHSANGTECDLAGSGGALGASGAVVIFRRQANGSWLREACIKAPNADNGDRFGETVALSGDTLAVAAPNEDGGSTGINGDMADNSLTASGAVYVYVRDTGGDWNLEAYVKPDPVSTINFGGDNAATKPNTGLALDGDVLVARGGRRTNPGGTLEPARVFVFERTGTTWSQVATFEPLGLDQDGYGRAIAIDGDRFVVGALEEDGGGTSVDDGGASDSGAVFVYERAGGVWGETAYIKASNLDAGDRFGAAVDLDGDELLVGAPREASSDAADPGDNALFRAGAVYRLRRQSDGSWMETDYLKALAIDGNDDFGFSVAFGANTIGVGVPGDDGVVGDPGDDSRSNSGAVYAFPR